MLPHFERGLFVFLEISFNSNEQISSWLKIHRYNVCRRICFISVCDLMLVHWVYMRVYNCFPSRPLYIYDRAGQASFWEDLPRGAQWCIPLTDHWSEFRAAVLHPRTMWSLWLDMCSSKQWLFIHTAIEKYCDCSEYMVQGQSQTVLYHGIAVANH